MSKPIARVVFAVLISLGVIAAISPNVQARLGSLLKAEAASAKAFVIADDQAVGRAGLSARVRPTYLQFENLDPGSSGGCHSTDPSIDD